MQPKPRERVIETLLQYLHTDSACCREEAGPVADRQAEVSDGWWPMPYGLWHPLRWVQPPHVAVTNVHGRIRMRMRPDASAQFTSFIAADGCSSAHISQSNLHGVWPQVFDPVLRWAEGELQAELVAGDNLLGMHQSQQLVNNAHSYLQGDRTLATRLVPTQVKHLSKSSFAERPASCAACQQGQC